MFAFIEITRYLAKEGERSDIPCVLAMVLTLSFIWRRIQFPTKQFTERLCPVILFHRQRVRKLYVVRTAFSKKVSACTKKDFFFLFEGQPLKTFLSQDHQPINMLRFSTVHHHGCLRSMLTYGAADGKLWVMKCDTRDVDKPVCLHHRYLRMFFCNRSMILLHVIYFYFNQQNHRKISLIWR